VLSCALVGGHTVVIAADRTTPIASLPTAVTAVKPPIASRGRSYQNFVQDFNSISAATKPLVMLPDKVPSTSTASSSSSSGSSSSSSGKSPATSGTGVSSVNTSVSLPDTSAVTAPSISNLDSRLRVPPPSPIRLHNRLFEGDRQGAPIVPREVVAMGTSAAALASIKTRGYSVVRERTLEPLDIKVVVLRPPLTLSTIEALDTLRAIDPEGTYDFNHLYAESDATLASESVPGPAVTAPLPEPAAGSAPVRIGLIDSGVEASHPAFESTRITSWGCEGNPVASAHGTAVASLMVGGAGAFRGVMPRAHLYSADIYCKSPSGGSATAILDALAWFAGEKVTVINMSLVGPHNAMLERAVAAMIKRGHVIVAAVGNDGPSAPPLYPAAYPNVVAVTGVDARLRVLPEACRGPHVTFAGPGAEMAAATTGHRYSTVRGTSYASPIVAAILARTLAAPDHLSPMEALFAMAQRAIDLGAPGRDPVYGYGVIGAQYRIGLAALN
jgi:subtilisin family serine protease